jgi:hypothetical protein
VGTFLIAQPPYALPDSHDHPAIHWRHQIAVPGLTVAISPLYWSGSLHTMDVRPGLTSGANNQYSILSLRDHGGSRHKVASTYRRVVDD